MNSERDASARALQTRSAILLAAEEEFAELGFAGARTEKIAERAGIKPATIFYHFSTKEDLYREVLRGLVATLVQDVRKILAQGEGPLDPQDRSALVRRGVDTLINYTVSHPRAVRLALQELGTLQTRNQDIVASIITPITRSFADLLSRNADQRDRPAADGTHILLALSGISLFLPILGPIVDPGFDPDDLDAHKAKLLDVAERLLGISPLG